MQSILAIGTALCSVVLASPLLLWIQSPPPPRTQFYHLQAKSSATTVTNQWVSLPSSGSNYVLASAQTSAAKFFVRKYNATNTWAFHNADLTRQVALQGPNGTLLYMVDVTNPSSSNIPTGQLMEWATFTFDRNVLSVNDGSTLKSRTFAAVQSGTTYQLALYDGVTNTTQAVTPLTLNVLRSTS